MKHLKLYAMVALSAVLFAGTAGAQGTSGNQTAAPASAAGLPSGKVQAFIVQGDVSLLKPDGSKIPLKKGDNFQEGSTVVAGPTGMALVVFSNGATMRVTPNAQLEITRFKQAPFDEKASGGTFLRLNADPSQSDTQLYLNNGTLQGEVKQLNQAAGSKFVVNTPAGSAGIRGTILSITVVRDATGRITGIVANCIVGNMSFTPATGGNAGSGNGGNTGTPAGGGVDVPGGGQVQISLTVNAAGQINGFSVGGAGLPTASSNAVIAEIFNVVNAARTDLGMTVAPPPSPPPPTQPTSSPGSTITVSQTTAGNPTPTTTTVAYTPPTTTGTATGTITQTNTKPNTNPTTVSE